MIVTETIEALRVALRSRREQNHRIALVPTMGNLHGGHLSLINSARQHADVVVVSLYVNPFQFGANEDLRSYPRTLAADQAALVREGVDVLFLPTDDVMYPRGIEQQTMVMVPKLDQILCGKSRPVFFRGVTTVVARLFNIVNPQVAVFGKKDYQQCIIIRRMVEDLAMSIDIIGVDIVREADGLAMSSRNGYLDETQRKAASNLYRVLNLAAAQLVSGNREFAMLENQCVQELESFGFKTDYVSIRRQLDLDPPQSSDRALVILAAAQLGQTRLIDNMEVNIERTNLE